VNEAPLYVDEPLPFCDCCERTVERVLHSICHGESAICFECLFMWYDPYHASIDRTDSVSIGNAVRKKHGLEPLHII